jgi:hypothetical protein
MPIWRSSTSSWSPPPRQGVADPSSVVDAQRRALLRRLRDAGSAGSDPAPRSRSRPASGARRYRARVHHRPPVHAELLGHLGDRPGELAGLPARLARALRVSTTCASRCSEVSVHVLRSHAGSGHRRRRLGHTSRAGRPKHDRCRIAVGRRPCATARLPQPGTPPRRRSSRSRSRGPRASRSPRGIRPQHRPGAGTPIGYEQSGVRARGSWPHFRSQCQRVARHVHA